MGGIPTINLMGSLLLLYPSRDGSSPSSGAAVTTEPRRFTIMVRTLAVHPLGGVVLKLYPLVPVAFWTLLSLCLCPVSMPERFHSCPTVIGCDWAVLPAGLMHEVVFSTRYDSPDGLGAISCDCHLPESNRYFRDCSSSCSLNQADLVVWLSCSLPKLQHNFYWQSNEEARVLFFQSMAMTWWLQTETLQTRSWHSDLCGLSPGVAPSSCFSPVACCACIIF